MDDIMSGVSDNEGLGNLVSYLKAIFEAIAEIVTTLCGFAGIDIDLSGIDLSGIGIDLGGAAE